MREETDPYTCSCRRDTKGRRKDAKNNNKNGTKTAKNERYETG